MLYLKEGVLMGRKVIFMYALTIALLSGCSNKNEIVTVTEENTEQSVSEVITDEQALTAIQNYCYNKNPDLENVISEGTYPVYWDILSSDDNEVVILFRSYTGAQNRYYIDRNNGDTYVTEFVPSVMDEEERTDESFNVSDFLK